MRRLYLAIAASRKLWAIGLALLGLALGGPSALADEPRTTIAGAAGYEPSVSPDLGGYGWVMVRYDREGLLPRGARLSLAYDTDTLRLTIDRARFDRVELGVGVFGEALLAGVLRDYYRDGDNDQARGFYASYAGAIGGAKIDLGPHFVELTAAARRWILARDPESDARLVLPPSAWVGELRARYTYWALGGDRSLWEPQRPFWRTHGVGVGVELAADVRSDVAPWGARGGGFSPRDPRNDPSRVIPGVSQWLRVGGDVARRVRLQLREEGHFLWGADDLVRLRVGGMNPYTVPLAGAPWGAYVSAHLVAVEGSVHVRVAGEHELGVLVDGVVLDDPRRVGDESVRVLAGVGAFADLRFRNLQLDARAGWSPTLRPGTAAGGYTVMLSLGWITHLAQRKPRSMSR